MELMQALRVRTVPYMLGVLLMVLGLLACGTAAPPDEPGDITIPQPPVLVEAPAPITSPQGAPQGEESPTPTFTPAPTPTPMPTRCRDTIEPDGSQGQFCRADPTPFPEPLTRADPGLMAFALAVKETAQKERDGTLPAGASSDMPRTAEIIVYLAEGNNGSALDKWLSDRNISIVLDDRAYEGGGIYLQIDLVLLPDLVAVEGISYVERVPQIYE